VNRRLKKRWVGSTDWDVFPNTVRCESRMGGIVNIDEVVFPTKGWSGMTVRTFSVEKRQWSLYWINSKTCELFPPVVGGFTGDHGEFYGDDTALVLNARLPSSRTLAKDFGVARNTVDWALGQLVSEGYIVRRRGAGSFVAPRLPEHDAPPLTPKRVASSKAARTERRLSKRATALRSYPGHYQPLKAVPFTPSLPPVELFPRTVWNRLLNREAARPGSAYWAYGASNGLPALREAIAAHTRRHAVRARRRTAGAPYRVHGRVTDFQRAHGPDVHSHAPRAREPHSRTCL
jgi:hypothetical protein